MLPETNKGEVAILEVEEIATGRQCGLEGSQNGLIYSGTSPPISSPTKRHKWGAKEVWGEVKPTEFAINTVNPIRRIVDAMAIQPNPLKELISLHIGDPTIAGILPTHPSVTQAVVDSVTSGKYNGYGPAFGLLEARQAVVDWVKHPGVTADDIILTSGCSHALEMAIEVLAGPGQNLLIPSPGFPLYQTLSVPLEVEPRHYPLLMERNWEVDLETLESLIDSNTAAILINNPSNPCGAVYSREHLEDILRLAERCKVPIIADEIYGDMVYDGAKFHPMATLEPKVPILTCDGVSKRWLIPGWRLGWLIINDTPAGALKEVAICARKLSQKIVGPSAIIQGALKDILSKTPEDFFQHTRDVLSQNAAIVMEELSGSPGLSPIRPNGAMYLMLGLEMKSFPAFHSDLEFAKALIAEESVYCLPGAIFSYPNALRLVITYRPEKVREACQRLSQFCFRHYRNPATLAIKNGVANGHSNGHSNGHKE